MKRKFFCIALMAAAAIFAHAQQYCPEDDFNVARSSDGNSVIINGHTGSNTAIRIPSRIRGLPVTNIGTRAFFGRNIESVVIPYGITYIGQEAFALNRLTSVVIPDSVTTIRNGAFRGNLRGLHGSEGPGGNQITSLTLGNRVTSIGERTAPHGQAGAFAHNRLTNVVIPESTTMIGAQAFGWNQLTNVTLPNSVTFIGAGAFRDNRLTGVTIPNRITSISGLAFANNQLTSIVIPDSVTDIMSGAFSRNQLTSVTISSRARIIEVRAFEFNNLTRITIGSNVSIREGGGFNAGFAMFYNGAAGRRAGTYVLSGGSWSEEW